jgi:hypothetical protein
MILSMSRKASMPSPRSLRRNVARDRVGDEAQLQRSAVLGVGELADSRASDAFLGEAAGLPPVYSVDEDEWSRRARETAAAPRQCGSRCSLQLALRQEQCCLRGGAPATPRATCCLLRRSAAGGCRQAIGPTRGPRG